MKTTHLADSLSKAETNDPHASTEIPATEYYPVSIGVGLMGDRWALLIVREMGAGARGFNEIHRALSGLSRSLLSARLRYLERIGVVTRASQKTGNRSVYALTESGEQLRPVLDAFGRWALKREILHGEREKSDAALTLWRMYRSIEHAALPDGGVSILMHFPLSEVKYGWLQAVASGSGSWGLGTPEHDVDLTVNASIDVLGDLWAGRRVCQKAISAGEISFDGPTSLARSFRSWFPHHPGQLWHR